MTRQYLRHLADDSWEGWRIAPRPQDQQERRGLGGPRWSLSRARPTPRRPGTAGPSTTQLTIVDSASLVRQGSPREVVRVEDDKRRGLMEAVPAFGYWDITPGENEDEETPHGATLWLYDVPEGWPEKGGDLGPPLRKVILNPLQVLQAIAQLAGTSAGEASWSDPWGGWGWAVTPGWTGRRSTSSKD